MSHFAALEARAHRAVRDHLSNAVAVFGASEVLGLWRTDYSEALNGLAAGAALLFDCESGDVPGVKRGDTLTIDSASYTVVSVEPTGTGWTTLVLQRA